MTRNRTQTRNQRNPSTAISYNLRQAGIIDRGALPLFASRAEAMFEHAAHNVSGIYIDECREVSIPEISNFAVESTAATIPKPSQMPSNTAKCGDNFAPEELSF